MEFDATGAVMYLTYTVDGFIVIFICYFVNNVLHLDNTIGKM